MSNRYYWLKLKRDFFKRHDIQIIEAMPNGKDYILFYLKLLCESVDHDGNLRFSDEIPYNEDMLATIKRTNIDVVRSAVKIFTELKMMEVMDDGTLYMSEVTKMLGSETAWAEKKRAYRQKQLELGHCPTNEDNVPTVSDKSKSKSESKSKNKENTKNKDDIFKDVPAELKEPFMEWVEMRKAIKKPVLTKNTVTRAINSLKKLSSNTDRQIQIIEQSIDHCWQSFYELKVEDIKPKAYAPVEKEAWERDDFVPEQMPENMKETMQKLGGMFNAG